MIALSVVIPTCNREESLAKCLSGIEAAAHGRVSDDQKEYPSEKPSRNEPALSAWEVIVSDDSKGVTAEKMIKEGFPWVRWISGPQKGPAANRNHGARRATGDWLAFIDDDCEPQPGWLDGLVAATHEADLVEGCTVAHGATDSPFEEHVENLHGGNLWSCNLAVRREVFANLGGFDEDFREAAGEDMEFAWRVCRAGLRIRFAPDALVHHPPRRVGWRGLWRRTWMIRWMPLYRLKTAQSKSLVETELDECVNLLRLTLHLLTRTASPFWRRHTFWVLWRWLTFPVVIPWLVFWEIRFRREFARRKRIAGGVL